MSPLRLPISLAGRRDAARSHDLGDPVAESVWVEPYPECQVPKRLVPIRVNGQRATPG